MARRLAEALREPLVLDGERRYVTASVGMSFSAPSEHDPHALLRDADAAMYRAKEMGKSRCEVFDDSIQALCLDVELMKTKKKPVLEAPAGEGEPVLAEG